MGHHLFVGPLCRFFAGDEVDASERVAGVEAWRAELMQALSGRGPAPEAWAEDPHAEVARFDLGAHGLAGVRLLAVHAQRTELALPDEVPPVLGDDRAWREAEAKDFSGSHYGQLLAASCWLPGTFDYTFRCPRPDGEDEVFGSLGALADQLAFLNERTVCIDGASRDAGLRLDGPAFVTAAQRGLAAFQAAVQAATGGHVPLTLAPFWDERAAGRR